MLITRTGWESAHPHHPEVPDSVEGLSERKVVGSGLADLDRWHPGWKIRCRQRRRQQWNDQVSAYCHDCRPQWMSAPAPGVVGRASLSSDPLGGSGCLLVSSVVGPAVGACRQGLSMSVGGVDGVTRTGLFVLVAAMWWRGPAGVRRTRVGSRR